MILSNLSNAHVQSPLFNLSVEALELSICREDESIFAIVDAFRRSILTLSSVHGNRVSSFLADFFSSCDSSGIYAQESLLVSAFFSLKTLMSGDLLSK